MSFYSVFLPPVMKDDKTINKEEQFIRDAGKVFLTYGIRSVTMDDIAKHLHISKKTIYRYVKDKNELVARCVQRDYEALYQKVEAVMAKDLNAIDENLEVFDLILTELGNIHPSIFYDLEKYYPEAKSKMLDMRQDFMIEVVRNNLIKGISEGVYRDDFNVEIMTRLWVTHVLLIFNPSLFSLNDFQPQEVYHDMSIHLIRGIANAKGIKKLEKHLLNKFKS